MNKKWALAVFAIFAMGLGARSFIPEVIAEPNSEKKNQNSKQKVQEFSSNASVDSTSKTTICHVPKGNPDNSHEIVVSTSSLTTHLNHGDSLGFCDE